MIKVILSDLARTFLFVKDKSWTDTLNKLYAKLENELSGYDFWEYFELDHGYLELMRELGKTYPVYMFTSGKIQNHPELQKLLEPVFKEIFNEEKVGGTKTDSGSYRFIAQKLGVRTDEILFIDDDINYQSAAREAGLKVHHMVGLEELKDSLAKENLYFPTLQQTKGYEIIPLTKELATKYQAEILAMLQLIPQVTYEAADVLAEENLKDSPPRELLGKWEYSLIAFSNELRRPIGVLIACERKAEDNDRYPQNSFFLNELAVDKGFQGRGIAKALIKTFLDNAGSSGFKHLKGPLKFTVQTNQADWNHNVQKLYEGFGFKQSATCVYDNRTDNIYSLSPKSDVV